MAVGAASKAVGPLNRQGIDTSAFHMKKLDIRSDQKRLEDLLDVKNYTHQVTLVDFDQISRKWLVVFQSKEAMKPWAHLTHWAGYPMIKSVGTIEAQT